MEKIIKLKQKDYNGNCNKKLIIYYMDDDILKNLNKEQKTAVLHDKGPLLIIAGAGTGKTTVITHRIAYLIKKKKARPEEILALTFTDKAATEMEERVDILVPYGFVDTWIYTFHAFGDRILRDHALEIGLSADFKVLSRSEQILFLRDHLSELNLDYYCPLSNPLHYLEALVSLFSRIKDEDISPEEFLKYTQKKIKKAKTLEEKEEAEKKLELAKVFNKYQELMLKEGNIDFGDQIALTLKLFREHPKILNAYRKQFKYILVDEFQDTNYIQNELIKILAGENGNITVVADDDQSIYRFRGAAVSNVLEFKKNFPKTKQIVLFRNYRSTQQILDHAYQLIQHNNPDRLEVKNNINKKLISSKNGSNPYLLQCNNLITEADKVASIIAEKVKSKNYSFKDFAILVRKNDQAKSFMLALNRYQIPYQFAGASGLYDREEIRLIISFMRALMDYEDSLAFYNLITSPIYQMPVQEAIKLNTYANKIKRSLAYLFENYRNLDDLYSQLSKKTIEIIERVNTDFNKFYQETLKSTASQLIYKFLKETGYLKNLVREADTDPMAGAKIQNIAKFFEKIREFEHISGDKSLLNFKNHLDILIEAGDDPATADIEPDLDVVNILTVHKAKGLEFKVVFLVNLYQGGFPVRKQPEILSLPEELIKETLPSGDYHLQEERRLFYVGVTRACDELYLSFAYDYGGKKKAKISQFVLEFFDQPELKSPIIKTEKLEIIKKSADYQEKYLLKNFYNGKKGILKLNPHQIDDYLSCPLKFKYIHILKIPILKHHPVVYGSAIHKAIEEYYIRRLNNYPIKISEILKTFEKNWESVGFITREHEEKRFLTGKKTLKNFIKKENKVKILPTFIEKKFNFALDLKKEKLKIKISGRYDALYLNNNPKYVEIRDFKTGEVTDQKKADLRVKQNRQMSIYALSWLINHHYLPDKVSLYFVDTGIIGEAHKTEKQLKKTEEEILLISEEIIKGNFEPKPKWQECKRCAYSDICLYTQSEV